MALDKETQDDFASIMAQFGLSEKVNVSPEEMFYQQQTSGASPKIDNLSHWLRHEMAHLDHLIECGVKLTLKGLKEGQPFDRLLTRIEYARLMVIYYMQMYHLTRFNGMMGAEAPRLDLDATVTLFMTWPEVKKIIGGR